MVAALADSKFGIYDSYPDWRGSLYFAPAAAARTTELVASKISTVGFSRGLESKLPSLLVASESLKSGFELDAVLAPLQLFVYFYFGKKQAEGNRFGTTWSYQTGLSPWRGELRVVPLRRYRRNRGSGLLDSLQIYCEEIKWDIPSAKQALGLKTGSETVANFVELPRKALLHLHCSANCTLRKMGL